LARQIVRRPEMIRPEAAATELAGCRNPIG
jgi:hypothetical protein